MSEPMILRARAAAPIKEVRQALTDAGALREWLAEHAEVDLPHRYEFWGRYTPEGDAPHQRLLHADDHALRFSWLLDGVETTTEIGLEEESATSTIVSLSQSHVDFQDATGASVRGALQTFWSLAIANLVDHVEGRPITQRVDFTSPQLRAEIPIGAPADVVFDSVTDSEKVSAWFGFPIAIEPYVGGRFAMGGFDAGMAAKIIDLDPGRKISIDWGPPGITTWELEGTGGQTRLTFVQSGFDGPNPPYAAWAGTLAGIAELRRYHELADWRPMWLPADPAGAPAAS